MSTQYRQTSKRTFPPLRRGGVADRTWMTLDPDDRADIGRRSGVSERDLAAVERNGCPTTVRGRVFSALATPALDAMIDALGGAADDPTPDELVAAAAEVSDRHTDAEIRFLFACVVEWRMPARGSILEITSADERYSIAPIGDGVVIPHRDGRCADPETRAERQSRRDRRAAEQARRRFQQAAARESGPAKSGRAAAEEGEDERWPEGSDRRAGAVGSDIEIDHGLGLEIDHGIGIGLEIGPEIDPEIDWGIDLELITPTRAVDRRLPAGVDGVSAPVGRIGSAYISWGSGQGNGKRRPVVIVGASQKHLWVRPCYSKDDCAGKWRAVAIDDWDECGLDHTSYVDLEVRRLARRDVKIGPLSLTLHDWNRICRGEVRPD